MALPTLSSLLTKLLNGEAPAHGSPLGTVASQVRLGDRLNELAAMGATSVSTLEAELAAITAGNGASKVGVQDVGTYYTGANVEAALQEVGAELADINADLADIIDGTATILSGGTSIVVAVGAGFNGKFPVVSFAEAPVAAAIVWAGPVAGGNLTININVNNTADLDVHYIIDGR